MRLNEAVVRMNETTAPMNEIVNGGGCVAEALENETTVRMNEIVNCRQDARDSVDKCERTAPMKEADVRIKEASVRMNEIAV